MSGIPHIGISRIAVPNEAARGDDGTVDSMSDHVIRITYCVP